jgi:hypothetical protein
MLLMGDWDRSYKDIKQMRSDLGIKQSVPSDFDGWIESKTYTLLVRQNPQGGINVSCWNEPNAQTYLEKFLKLPKIVL